MRRTTHTDLTDDELLEVIDAMSAAIVAVDPSWRLLLVSRRATHATGLDGGSVGSALWEAAPHLFDATTRAALERAMATGEPWRAEAVSLQSGRWMCVEATHVSTGLIVELIDIHEKRVTDERLRRQDEHYRRILQQSGLITARIDLDLRYVWVDNIHPDFDRDAVIGKRDYDIDDNEGTRALVALKREVIATRRGVRQEIIFPLAAGPRTFAVHGEPLFDDKSALIGMTTVSLDVTDMRSVEVAAHTDFLTGADNRRAIERRIVEEIERTDRYGGGFSIVLLDIDHFKTVNDVHGHAVGDDVLREIVACLQVELRTVDRIGRWGGEEFLLLLPEVVGTEAMLAGERLRCRVDAHAFAPAGPLTVSIGVATHRQGETLEALLARADAALYRAKHGGRNSVVGE